MVRVMVPPESTEVAGVNTRTGLAEAPETCDKGVTEAKVVIVVPSVDVVSISMITIVAANICSIFDF
jgi:hypothetical protein